MGQWLSDDYEIYAMHGEELDWYDAIYHDSQNHSITFISHSLDAISRVDAEGARVIEELELCGCRVVLIIKDSDVRLSWIDETVGISCLLNSDNHTAEEVLLWQNSLSHRNMTSDVRTVHNIMKAILAKLCIL